MLKKRWKSKIVLINIKGSDSLGIVFHGSKEHGLKRLEPRNSTHGEYVYATP